MLLSLNGFMSISIENNVKHFSQLLDKTSSYIHAIFRPASPPPPYLPLLILIIHLISSDVVWMFSESCCLLVLFLCLCLSVLANLFSLFIGDCQDRYLLRPAKSS